MPCTSHQGTNLSFGLVLRVQSPGMWIISNSKVQIFCYVSTKKWPSRVLNLLNTLHCLTKKTWAYCLAASPQLMHQKLSIHQARILKNWVPMRIGAQMMLNPSVHGPVKVPRCKKQELWSEKKMLSDHFCLLWVCDLSRVLHLVYRCCKWFF